MNRRDVLAAGGAALLLPSAASLSWAQGLQAAPKQALVIGNAAYRHVPALRNPSNDARAMSAALKECGFEVTMIQDGTRAQMLEAFDAYARRLAERKAVGVFYFAGHGVQLAWRNYLLPVDAQVAKLDDIAARCVDVTDLMAGLRKSANPMNVVVLDACRDNPFPGELKPGAAGLSQMDAPPATLIAYATAPGNTADDGAGENGVFTGHLVREMRVKEAPIEDVFKRVRLNVRRQSKGAQIPWESTSLEEDFYFVPPARLARASDAEARKAFEAELALWESIKAANEPAPFEEYLRRHPSGRFSELAQFRLDTLLAKRGEKRVQVVSAAGNPNSAGTARADTAFRVGDSYTYRIADLDTNAETGRTTDTVTAVTETEVIFDEGRRITDLLGNLLRDRDGRTSSGVQIFGLEYSVGKRWTSRARTVTPGGIVSDVEVNLRVVAREKVTVPAGTFECFHVRGIGIATAAGGHTARIAQSRWLAPDKVRAPVKHETLRTIANGRVITSTREELVAFRQS